MNSTRANAFTLIELLVVIAIIAILASMLVPALSRAREKARTTACANQMKQVSLAILQYVNDEDGFFPIGSYNNTLNDNTYHVTWDDLTNTYTNTPALTQAEKEARWVRIGDAKNIYRCPADNTPPQYDALAARRTYSMTRGIDTPAHYNSFPGLVGFMFSLKQNQVMFPSDTYMLVERAATGSLLGNTGAHNCQNAQNQWDANSSLHDFRRYNYAHVDGHVAYIDSQMVTPNGANQWANVPWNARRTQQ